MRTLVFTASEANILLALDRGVMGFSSTKSPRGGSTFGQDAWINEPTNGDRALLYAKGKGVVAAAEVTSTLYESSERLWSDAAYPYRVNIRTLAQFAAPLAWPAELAQRSLTRRNPRLLTAQEIAVLAPAIGHQLIG